MHEDTIGEVFVFTVNGQIEHWAATPVAHADHRHGSKI